MNERLIVVLICSFIPTFTCIGQGINNIRETNWISVDYIKQTENCLPCDCADSVNYPYYISIDNDNITKEDIIFPEVIVNYIIQTEPDLHYIIFADTDKFVISNKSNKWEDKVFELTLNNDTLLLIDNNNSSRKFIRSSLPFNSYNDCYGCIDNIALLNKSLSLRGYPSIQTILKVNDLVFKCRALPEDKVNILYSQKKPKSWVLEIDNGYLFIRKVLNPQRDQFAPIITKVIKVLKWDTENKNDAPTYEKIKVFETTKWIKLISD